MSVPRDSGERVPPPSQQQQHPSAQRTRGTDSARSSRRDARLLAMKNGARERSSSLPKFVIQHPSPDRNSLGSQGIAEEGSKKKSDLSKNLSRVSFHSQTQRSESARSGTSSKDDTPTRHSAATSSNIDQPQQLTSDAETDSARTSSFQKGRSGSAGHSSDDASTSSGPAIHMANIEGNKRATNKVESWLRKAAQKKEEIAKEQKQRDENVDEYLRMAQNADKSQLPRLKAIFEKRNLKHNVEIHKAQKDLEKYLHKIEDLTGTPPASLKKVKDAGGSSAGASIASAGGVKGKDTNLIDNLGQGLKSVGANIREGITDLGGTVIAKPRDLATSIHSAFRQKKFGSADNIHQMDDTPPTDGAAAGSAAAARNAAGRRTIDNHLLVDSPYGGTPTGPHSIGPSSSAQGLASENALSSTPRPTGVGGGGSSQVAAAFNTAFNVASIHNNNRPSDDENSSLASGAESLGAGGSLGGNGHHGVVVGPYHHRAAHSASPTHKPMGGSQQPFPFPGQPFPMGDFQGKGRVTYMQKKSCTWPDKRCRYQAPTDSLLQERLKEMQGELQAIRESHENSVELIKTETSKLQDEMSKIQQHLEEQLREAQYRYERLEEQMNDNTELHRNELLNLKQDLAQFAVKEELERVEYRSRERSDELNEQLEACDNRVQRMEKQAHDAQMLSLEGLEATSLSSLPKLINIVLQLLGLVIVILNTACSVVMPFLRTRVRMTTTIVLVAAIVFMHHKRNFMWNVWSLIIEEYRHLTALQ